VRPVDEAYERDCITWPVDPGCPSPGKTSKQDYTIGWNAALKYALDIVGKQHVIFEMPLRHTGDISMHLMSARTDRKNPLDGIRSEEAPADS
jgi:hypothetical protein